MGAYVSISECHSHYNIDINCDFRFNLTEEENHVGGLKRGEVPPDSDVAGIGIVSMFIGVTSFALVLSAIDLIWRFSKTVGWKSRSSEFEKRQKLKRSCGGLSLSTLLEALVLSCSDQQAFTGGAYAITLRYWKGCSITAYHYSIVANMMLLTCATHLMSVAIVRDYWRYPWLAIIRVIIITGVFTFTGLILANQNANNDIPFPSKVPAANETNSPLLVLAACFQGGSGLFADTFRKSFQDEKSFNRAVLESAPGNVIEGWNFYLIILLCYAAAIVVEVVRYILRSDKSQGKSTKLFRMKTPLLSEKITSRLRPVVMLLYGVYLVGCVSISGVTIGFEATYMMNLRTWVRKSGWLEADEFGQSEEDDGTSFGQLVPIFLGLLTLFTFAEMISQMGSRKGRRIEGGHGAIDGEDTESGKPAIRMSQYQALPQSQSSPPTSTAAPIQSLGSLYQPSFQMQDSHSQHRPHLSNRDTTASGAPLLGGSPYAPSNASSTPAFSPTFSPNRHHSEMSSYSSYFPIHQEGSIVSQQGRRDSIARKPVGATSPDVGQNQAFFVP